MKTKLQAAVEMGRLGGKAGRGKCKARTSEQARKAALVRVERMRERCINKFERGL